MAVKTKGSREVSAGKRVASEGATLPADVLAEIAKVRAQDARRREELAGFRKGSAAARGARDLAELFTRIANELESPDSDSELLRVNSEFVATVLRQDWSTLRKEPEPKAARVVRLVESLRVNAYDVLWKLVTPAGAVDQVLQELRRKDPASLRGLKRSFLERAVAPDADGEDPPILSTKAGARKGASLGKWDLIASAIQKTGYAMTAVDVKTACDRAGDRRRARGNRRQTSP
jgi:hypothetical protein